MAVKIIGYEYNGYVVRQSGLLHIYIGRRPMHHSIAMALPPDLSGLFCFVFVRSFHPDITVMDSWA